MDFGKRFIISTFPGSGPVPFSSTSLRDASENGGTLPRAKNSPPDCFYGSLRCRRPFESRPEYQKTRYPDGYLVFWYTGRDSNPQPSEPESDALSIEPPVRLLYSGSIISGFWDFVKGNSKNFSAFFRQRAVFSLFTAKETVVFPPILWYNQQKHFAGEGTLRWNS